MLCTVIGLWALWRYWEAEGFFVLAVMLATLVLLTEPGARCWL
jgi:hypothetical protein